MVLMINACGLLSHLSLPDISQPPERRNLRHAACQVQSRICGRGLGGGGCCEVPVADDYQFAILKFFSYQEGLCIVTVCIVTLLYKGFTTLFYNHFSVKITRD